MKKNGVFHARLLAKGYNQVAGVDFMYNFAPVMNDMTFKVLLTLWLKGSFVAKMLDI